MVFSSVAHSCPILCNHMNCSMPGFSVHHQHPELAQTHVHRVSDTIQPSRSLLSSSPPAFNLSQHQGLFQWVTSSVRWPKYWSFSFSIRFSDYSSGLISFKIEWFDLLAVWRILESFPTPQFKSINSLVLSFLHSPTLTSLHDHWKNHSLDYMDLCWQSNVSAF